MNKQARITEIVEKLSGKPLAIGQTPAAAVVEVPKDCLVLVAGSDRIGDFLKGDAVGASEKASKPVEIVGRVQLIEPEAPARERLGRSA